MKKPKPIISGIILICFILAIGIVLRSLIGTVKLPADAQELDYAPRLYPDYSDLVIPCNIAPMNFAIREEGSSYIARLAVEGGTSFLVKGKKSKNGGTIQIPEGSWKELLDQARGKKISPEIFVFENDCWKKFRTIENSVSSDPIDGWVMYRLIEPGYEFFNEISLNQRNLESFQSESFAQNNVVSDQMCMNCHSFQDRRTNRFMFHTRNYRPGTVLVDNGVARKVDLKPEGLFSACTYPAWHPTDNLLAFSVNKTFQAFHTVLNNRIEVMDNYSDLACFYPDRNEIVMIRQTPYEYETFPNWSPDGSQLYYCRANFQPEHKVDLDLNDDDHSEMAEDQTAQDAETEKSKAEFNKRYREFKYDLMRIRYDSKERKFGEPELVINAAELGKSIVHPRVSPDGRWLMFTMSSYGTFPIWHRDSDLYLLDLTNGKIRALDEINSQESESYHTWDSSGKWFVFSSRREDGNFTRLYFAHFEEGKASKPFLLPQKDPDQNGYFMKSYNVPELVREPVHESIRKLTKAAQNASPEPTVLRKND